MQDFMRGYFISFHYQTCLIHLKYKCSVWYTLCSGGGQCGRSRAFDECSPIRRRLHNPRALLRRGRCLCGGAGGGGGGRGASIGGAGGGADNGALSGRRWPDNL